MADVTTRFFEELDRRGYEPLLEKEGGSLRFDLRHGTETTRWLLFVDRGRVRARQEDREADTVVTADADLFEEIVTGRADGLAALLRGDMTIDGDPRLVVQVERIFPGSPDARGPRRVPGGEAH